MSPAKKEQTPLAVKSNGRGKSARTDERKDLEGIPAVLVSASPLDGARRSVRPAMDQGSPPDGYKRSISPGNIRVMLKLKLQKISIVKKLYKYCLFEAFGGSCCSNTV